RRIDRGTRVEQRGAADRSRRRLREDGARQVSSAAAVARSSAVGSAVSCARHASLPGAMMDECSVFPERSIQRTSLRSIGCPPGACAGFETSTTKAPPKQGLQVRNALEWTRTTTGEAPHKALN